MSQGTPSLEGQPAAAASANTAPAGADYRWNCGPLRDPVRALSIALTWGFIVGAVLMPILMFGTADSPWIMLAVVAGMLLLMAMVIVAMRSLFWAHKTRALLVRRFINDAASRRLQQLLAAGLGDKVRLCGIRSPTKRVPGWLRLLFWTQSAVYYLGSQYQQLEAENDDWLFRMARSLETAQLAIIDLRNATRHVLIEARVCVTSLGVGRCVFLIDGARSEAEWLKEVGLPSVAAGAARVLQVPAKAEEEDGFVQAVSAIAGALPERQRDAEALAGELRSFSASPPQGTAFLRTDWGQFLACFVLATAGSIMAAALCGAIFGLRGMVIYDLSMGLFQQGSFILLVLMAWCRLWRNSNLKMPAAAGYRKAVRKRLGYTVKAAGVYVLALSLPMLLLPNLGKAKELANRQAELTNLSGIARACIVYASNNGDQMPESLAQVVASGELDPRYLVARSSGTEPLVLTAEQMRAGSEDWHAIQKEVEGHCDYVYVGAGSKASYDSGRILLYLPPRLHNNEMALVADYVGFADAMRIPAFSQAIDVTNAFRVQDKLPPLDKGKILGDAK